MDWSVKIWSVQIKGLLIFILNYHMFKYTEVPYLKSWGRGRGLTDFLLNPSVSQTLFYHTFFLLSMEILSCLFVCVYIVKLWVLFQLHNIRIISLGNWKFQEIMFMSFFYVPSVKGSIEILFSVPYICYFHLFY